jgi:hypothetical protein
MSTTSTSSALTYQIVVRYPDATYAVRTYRIEGRSWVLDSEKPANTRSVAQATLAGRVCDAAEDPLSNR